MNEQIQLVRGYVRMVWPYRWVSLVVATAMCMAGWTYVYTLPNEYEVSTKIFIDTRSMLRPLLKGLAVENYALVDAALMMRKTLMTRPNLEEVARRTDLDLRAQTPQEFDRLIERLSRDLNISGTPRDGIFEIKYVNSDPAVAKRVVDELLNTFLESALGDNRKDTAITQKFLDEQIAEYERRLLEAEERLKEFKRRNVGVMPGTGSDYYSRLQEQEALLNEARLQLQEAANRRDQLKRVMAGERPMVDVMGNGPGGPTEAQQYADRIVALQQRRDELLLQYTDKHPDISNIDSTIETLVKRRQEALENAATIDVSNDAEMATNPVYQEMKIQLAAADGEVAALQARVKEYESRAAELGKLVNTVPEVEAELSRLNRDYGLHKRQYEELIQRRESARLSQEADESADDIKLKVIEPPRVPLTPVGPDRPKFLSAVLVVALGAGAVVAFFLSQLRPRFFTTEALKDFAGIPVLGGVSLVQSSKQRTERRMELAAFGMVLLMLIGLYGGLMALPALDVDLHDYVARILKEKA